MQLYKDIISRCILLEEDEEHLMKHRGFTKEIIEEAQFRSVHGDNEKEILDLLDSYTRSEMMDAGVVDRFGDVKPYLYKRDLDEKQRILIPFFSGDDIIYIRGHKYGPKDTQVPLYVPLGMPSKDYVILAESEFKAVACRQWGFFAVGLCGITTYADKYFDDLINYLKNFNLDKVYFLWDNDNQYHDNEHFRDRMAKRFDVETYAYYMAYKLNREEGFENVDVRIAELPEEWRQDGKIDLDAALAQGKDAEDIQGCLFQSMTPSQYRKSWKGEQKTIAEKKVARKFFWSTITEDFGCYVNGKGNRISNFTLSIMANMQNEDEELDRLMAIKTADGSVGKLCDANPGIITSLFKFKEWLCAQGNYSFTGSQGDLDEIRKRLFEFDDNLTTYSPMCEGYFMDGYLFHDLRIADGRTMEADSQGIMWNGQCGFKPRGLAKGKGDDGTLKVRINTDDFDYRDAMKRLVGNWDIYEPVLAVGWIMASVFADAFGDRYGMFPILWISGEPSGGKTTLCRYLSSFHGTERLCANVKETTKPGMLRTLSYYSNLCVWYDEYEDEKAIEDRHGMFRSVYNRQGSIKADRNTDGSVIHQEPRACMMISGTVLPSNDALLSRTIHLSLASQSRNGNEYRWLELNKRHFSHMYYDLAMRRTEVVDELLDTTQKIADTLVKDWALSERYAINYAMVLSALKMFTPDLVENSELFHKWCHEHSAYEQLSMQEEHVLHAFLSDVADIFAKKEAHIYEKNSVKIAASQQGNQTIYINLKNAYNSYLKHLKTLNLKPQCSLRDIRDYMKSAGWKQTTTKMEDKTLHAMSTPVKRMKDTDTLSTFMSVIPGGLEET